MTETAFLDEREVAILHWRCRRGLVENDLFLERFFKTYGQQLSADQAHGLTQLMDLSDNDLLDLFLRRKEPEGALNNPKVTAVLAQVRTPQV